MSTEYYTEEERANIRLARLGSQRVRILSGAHTGECGTVYDYLPGRWWPWHVRIDGTPEDEPGLAFLESELDFFSWQPLDAYCWMHSGGENGGWDCLSCRLALFFEALAASVPHPEFCLCDECERDHHAMTGEWS